MDNHIYANYLSEFSKVNRFKEVNNFKITTILVIISFVFNMIIFASFMKIEDLFKLVIEPNISTIISIIAVILIDLLVIFGIQKRPKVMDYNEADYIIYDELIYLKNYSSIPYCILTFCYQKFIFTLYFFVLLTICKIIISVVIVLFKYT